MNSENSEKLMFRMQNTNTMKKGILILLFFIHRPACAPDNTYAGQHLFQYCQQ